MPDDRGPESRFVRAPQEFGAEFLAWFRAATEDAWADFPERRLADFERAGVGGSSWRRGTRWSGGLNEDAIDDAERRFGIAFPPEHRLFLGVLHATTPRCRRVSFGSGSHMVESEAPAFFDWRHDEREIRAAMAWPLEGLLFDVENNGLWPPSWGPRSESADGRRACVAERVAAAPALIPIVGHRYAVAGTSVVLSVYQSDVIVYGRDLRSFLLHELHGLLGLTVDPAWTETVEIEGIPFWGELAG